MAVAAVECKLQIISEPAVWLAEEAARRSKLALKTSWGRAHQIREIRQSSGSIPEDRREPETRTPYPSTTAPKSTSSSPGQAPPHRTTLYPLQKRRYENPRSTASPNPPKTDLTPFPSLTYAQIKNDRFLFNPTHLPVP
jgi:hypothetical protein